MFEDFINALQNFRHNKVRTILSLLGVIIGVASVIVVSTIGNSAAQNIMNSFGSSGMDFLEVYVNNFDNKYPSLALNERFRSELINAIPDIRDVYYSNTMNGSIQSGSILTGSMINAVDVRYLENGGFELDSGSWFTATDDFQGVQKILLGSEIASVLFPQGNAVGKTVMLYIDGIKYGCEVAGVLKSQQSMPYEMPDRNVYMPRGFYKKKTEPDPLASRIIVQATDFQNSALVQKHIEEFALAKTGDENSVYVFSIQTVLDQYNSVIGTVSLLLSGVAAISLLVGGIGIMNIMIVTVTERKREIGIRKALGASPGAIRSQFLVESAAITLTGGLFGIVLGLGISYLVVLIAKWSFVLDWTVCLTAFVFSAAIGVFFGLNPALRAAKLDPVDALAGE